MPLRVAQSLPVLALALAAALAGCTRGTPDQTSGVQSPPETIKPPVKVGKTPFVVTVQNANGYVTYEGK